MEQIRRHIGARVGFTIASAILLGSCGGGGSPQYYDVGGTVSGLAQGSSLVLQINGGDPTVITSNSSFSFSTRIAAGASYNVTISTQALYQGCAVNGGSGTVASGAITNIEVYCPSVETLWSFGYGTDGNFPQAGLILGQDGNFYGTTSYGGLTLGGTVYSITPGGVETVLSAFQFTNGMGPTAAVVQGIDGNFYGTTYTGGTNGMGTVFEVTPSGSQTILWSFGSGNDGQYPSASLIQAADGDFYGTTTAGGTSSSGTAFRISPSGAETVLWSFGAGLDGFDPLSALVQGADGNFYGTTSLGGTYGRGTVFTITPGGVETVLWNLGAVGDGYEPHGNLLQATDGNFYGTTFGGGKYGGGTVFEVTPTGTETILWSFGSGSDGSILTGGVIQARDGNFYGTTAAGGTINSAGTVFRLTSDGVETVLWDFGFGGNGAYSWPFGLVEGNDGNLYGVTDVYGTASDGSVFKVTL